MNLPNSITLTRICSIPLLIWILSTNHFQSRGGEKELLASALFIAASITDGIDGYLARKRGQITTMGVLLDLLLGGPGAPVGVSALGFVLIRAAVANSRRYLVGVPFLFQWLGFCLLALGFVLLVWIFTSLWTWTAIDPLPALVQYVVVIVLYPLLAPLLARVRARDPLNVPELSRGTARPGETTS